MDYQQLEIATADSKGKLIERDHPGRRVSLRPGARTTKNSHIACANLTN